jgi:hypothetical protein
VLLAYPIFRHRGPSGTEGSVTGSAETKLKDGISKVRFHVTDDGGDNFKVKTKLLIYNGQECAEDQTGIMTVWKKLDVEEKRMAAEYDVPTDALEALMEDRNSPFARKDHR